MPSKAQQAQETAIVLADAADYPMVYMDPADLRETIQTNLEGETLNFKDLRRVKVPTGGAESWSIPAADGGKPIPTNDFDGIIIHTELSRVMWLKDMGGKGSGGNKGPDCSGKPVRSDDPKINGTWFGSKSREWIAEAAGTGIASVAVDPRPQPCADCPFSQWGSGRNGKGQKCQQKRVFFIAQEDSLLPLVLIAPVMSLDNAKKYLTGLSMNLVKQPNGGKPKGVQYHEVITNFSLEADSNGENDFAKIVFSRKSYLPDDQRAAFANYRAAMLPLVTKLVGVAAAAPAADGPTDAPNDFDDYNSKIEYIDADAAEPTDAD